ncbi:potassium-transporting ATPase subunit KdpC [Salinicola sp. JS01]|uniref:potassium-transporting ATPase subunit KdpC n=1 Tax=Salinicola sp. JS01 TaxID=3050071 RepID=UPI00255BD07F|nr:potassium-transporting ATPase subunit KdpC [Salinicola sp. JS01]WIX32814.1 potassium-transporting ATPase subunit KdpC [Salinicola sp. JS01]
MSNETMSDVAMSDVQRVDETGAAAAPARAGAGWGSALRFTFAMALLLGLLYPLAVVGLGQWLFPHQANASLLADPEGRVLGSTLVGQAFTGERYFQGRPSAVDYAADTLGGSNLAPSNPALRQRVEADAKRITARDGVAPGRIPGDLLTASGSGVDPHISPQAAAIQIARVARARGLREADVRALVARYSDSGGFGQPRVAVLPLNLALDGIAMRPLP